jgi:large subunit ribosomal protein L24
MKKEFSKNWKRSKSVRKQRKYRYNAPLHIKRRFLAAHLNKDLKKKYGKRSLIIRKGDRVKVERGIFKKKISKVNKVDISNELVYLDGISVTKKDGSKVEVGLHPSNLTILELTMEDKERVKSINRGKNEQALGKN